MKLFAPIPKWKYAMLSCASFTLFLAFWIILSATLESAAIFLPSPWAVLCAGYRLFVSHSFHLDVLASVWRVMIGFAAAVVVAIPLGVFAGTHRSIDAVIQPFNDFVRYMPVAAFVPLTILWLGVGNTQKMMIIFLGTVFQLVPLVTDTVRMVTPTSSTLATRWDAVRCG